MALTVSAAQAAYPPEHEIWLVSTRRAPVCAPGIEASACLDFWRLGPDNQWAASDRSAFVATASPAVPVEIFLHGNRVDRNDAVYESFKAYRHVACQAAGRPLRFVIWSWPADEVSRRSGDDARVKAARCGTQGHYLAGLLSELDPGVHVGLVGYSFGARIAGAALHLLGGGAVDGRVLANRRTGEHVPYRLMLVAAGMNSDSLLPGRTFGLAMTQVEAVIVTRNRNDPVLRWYPLLYRRLLAPQSLGYVGPACNTGMISVYDVTCSVGRSHSWDDYLRASAVHGHLGWVGFADAAAVTGPAIMAP